MYKSLLFIKVAILVCHSLFYLFDFLLSAHNPFPCSATILYLSFSFPLPAKLILILPYSRRIAKIKKNTHGPKGFESTTSQVNASNSYHYTIYVFMSTSITVGYRN
jgi:hypothetical protein